MRCDFNKMAPENFNGVWELFGEEVVFSDLRIDRTTLPEGVYAYDIRHDDECQGDWCQLKSFVVVNYWGTALSNNPDLLRGQDSILIGEDDYGELYPVTKETLSCLVKGLMGREESLETDSEGKEALCK